MRRAWLAGAALSAALALAPALLILRTNPWFMDAPLLYLAAVSAPLTLLGGLLGALVPRPSPRGSAAALVLALLAVPALSLWPRPGPTGRVQLFVFGMDGATWDVIDPMQAELPALNALRDEGGWTTLRSMEPLFSPLLWTTMASGKPPEQHGIHGFHVHATDCQVPRFWDIMHASGLSVGTWKWLVSWPPSRIGAFQVPAWLAPEPDTWPEDLSFVKEIELSRRMMRKQVAARRSLPELAWAGAAYGLRFSTLVKAARVALLQRLRPDPLRDFYEGQILRVWMDRDVAIAALHRGDPAVFTFTDYATDAIPHRFWRYHEPARFPDTDPALVQRWGQAVKDTYRQADAVLADLREAVGPQARVVVLSDHGHHALEGAALGHLLSPRTERLTARLSAEVGPVDVSRLGHKLVVALKGPDVAEQRARAIAWLQQLTVDRTGQPVFRAEEGPAEAGTLGLAVVEDGLSPATLKTDTLGGQPLSDYLSAGEAFSGDHHDRGIWVSAGPGLAAGAVPEMRILDVAPTLLALVGLPKAADMVGVPAPELWEEGPPDLGPGPATYDDLAAKRDFTVTPEGVDEVNEEQLKALGYVQ